MLERGLEEECSLRAHTCVASHDTHLLITANIAALSLLTPSTIRLLDAFAFNCVCIQRIRYHLRLHGPSYEALLSLAFA